MKLTNEKMKRKLGQNTAEYLLLLLLVGGGSIVAFKYFGAGIINRFNSIVAVMGGQAAGKAPAQAQSETVDFTTFDKQGGSNPGTSPAQQPN